MLYIYSHFCWSNQEIDISCVIQNGVYITFFFFFFLAISSHFSGRRQWQPTPVLLPGESHGWRSLVVYSPWGCKESDTTEQHRVRFSLLPSRALDPTDYHYLGWLLSGAWGLPYGKGSATSVNSRRPPAPTAAAWKEALDSMELALSTDLLLVEFVQPGRTLVLLLRDFF